VMETIGENKCDFLVTGCRDTTESAGAEKKAIWATDGHG
jgi:hypothetical protein